MDICLWVIIFFIINAASFTIMRLAWCSHDRLAMKRVTLGQPPGTTDQSDETERIPEWFIFIAGNLNQSPAAFRRVMFEGDHEDEPPILPVCDQRCIFLQYRWRGFSALQTANQVLDEVFLHNVQHITVFTISLGDHVARYLEDELEDRVTVYAINPCPTVACMKLRWIAALTLGAPIFEILCHAFGWLSLLPIIPTVSGRYSPILLADQYWSLMYNLPPNHTEQTEGVILSLDDSLLNNKYIKQMFHHVKPIYVSAGHGDTVGAPSAFRAAMRSLLQQK